MFFPSISSFPDRFQDGGGAVNSDVKRREKWQAAIDDDEEVVGDRTDTRRHTHTHTQTHRMRMKRERESRETQQTKPREEKVERRRS